MVKIILNYFDKQTDTIYEDITHTLLLEKIGDYFDTK
jgi:predicted Zn-dependent protease with MMP-like domain